MRSLLPVLTQCWSRWCSRWARGWTRPTCCRWSGEGGTTQEIYSILCILILKLREVSEDHTYDTIEFNEVNSLTVLLHCWLFLTFLIENVLLSFILFVHLYSWKTLAKTKMTPNALLTQNTTCKKRYLRWKWVANVVLLKFLQMMSKQTNKPLTPKDLIEAFR